MITSKNTMFGKSNYFFILLFFLFLNPYSNSEDNISISPLINIDEIKPSFEEISPQSNNKKNLTKPNFYKEPELYRKNEEFSAVKVIGLDKITAKTVELVIKIGDKRRYGGLEIKPLKCGKVIKKNFESEDVAYLQIKDTKESENDKVFIFNGWTFSSNAINSSIDHAIYDVWLVSCTNV